MLSHVVVLNKGAAFECCPLKHKPSSNAGMAPWPHLGDVLFAKVNMLFQLVGVEACASTALHPHSIHIDYKGRLASTPIKTAFLI